MASSLRDLTERITIQQVTLTADTLGGRTESWATLATVWAKALTNAAPGDTLRGASVSAATTSRFEVEYRPDVTSAMRVSWTPYRATTAKTFQITAVSPKTGSHERLILECVESV